MKPSHAFELIKSLNMSEKRQFAVYTGRHVIGESNKYVTLYHLLEQMERYDETNIKQALQQTGLSSKYLKADQNYLYNLVLNSLTLQHNGKSANLQVKDALIAIEMLFDKGLFRQCKKEIAKATAIAKAYELFDLQINLLLWERKILLNSPDKNRNNDNIHKDIASANKQLNLITDYIKLYDTAVNLRQAVIKTRKPADFAKFQKLLKTDLLVKQIKLLPVQARIRYHQIYAMWYYVKHDKANEMIQNKAIIKILDTYPHFKAEYPLDYIAIYSRILAITKTGPQQIFEQELATFRSFKPLTQSIAYDNVVAQIFAQSYMIQLSQLLSSNQFYAAGKLLPELNTGIKYHNRFINPVSLMSLQFIAAYTTFANGDYSGARSLVNKLLNQFDDSLRPDIYNFTRLLNLMIHLELRNYSNIKSAYSSVNYYFNKHKQLFKTESLVLQFFSNPKNYMYNAQPQLLVLQTALIKIKETKIEQYALNYIDFFTWINGRLNKIPMSHVKQFA